MLLVHVIVDKTAFDTIQQRHLYLSSEGLFKRLERNGLGGNI